jgi:hypothetical protein
MEYCNNIIINSDNYLERCQFPLSPENILQKKFLNMGGGGGGGCSSSSSSSSSSGIVAEAVVVFVVVDVFVCCCLELVTSF